MRARRLGGHPAGLLRTSAVIIALILLGRCWRRGPAPAPARRSGPSSACSPAPRGWSASGQEVDIPIAEVRVGDIVVVRPGERIPVDGEVIEGQLRGR